MLLSGSLRFAVCSGNLRSYCVAGEGRCGLAVDSTYRPPPAAAAVERSAAAVAAAPLLLLDQQLLLLLLVPLCCIRSRVLPARTAS
jgi:hypothetical protein